MRAASIGLASLVLVGFAVVGLSGGWHGQTLLLGLVLTVGYALLTLYACLNPGSLRFAAAALLGLSTLFAATLFATVELYMTLQGNLFLPLLAAGGLGLLATQSTGHVRILQAIAAAILVLEALWFLLLESAVLPDPVAYLWGIRSLDLLVGLACAGLFLAERGSTSTTSDNSGA